MDVPWFWQDPESGTVAPLNMFNVDLLFTALDENEGPLPLGEYHTTLIVVHSDPLKETMHIPVTMHVVLPDYGLELSPATDALPGNPGQTVDYSLTLTNTGNVTDTFELTFADNTWDVHLPETIFELAAGASVDVSVHVTVPEEAHAGDEDTVIITATSQGDADVTASSTLTTTANPVYGLLLEPEVEALSGEPGHTVEFSLTLTNTGNATDTFEFTFADNAWDVHLPQSSFELEAGASVDVSIHVTIPATAEPNDFDIVIVTATSTGDGSVAASSTLTTVVVEPTEFFLFMSIVVKQ